jgi:hypothetical protein
MRKPSDVTITIDTSGLSAPIIAGIATVETWFDAALATWEVREDWKQLAFPYSVISGHSAPKEDALRRLLAGYARCNWTVQPYGNRFINVNGTPQLHFVVAFSR